MKFEEIIGNIEVKKYLKESIEQNNILHSYMFEGTEGIGKFLMAKEFAKKILCISKENDCTCKSCNCFESNNHPDFFAIDKKNETITIDTIRKLTNKVYEKPIMSEKKIYIINNCDKMTIEAQNCLLKTLEEPPEFVVIILITSNENMILNTIKSRCMSVKFKNIDDKSIFSYCKEKLGYDDISKNLLKSFNGSIGNAIKNKEYKEKYDKVDSLVNNLEKLSIIDLLKNRTIFDKDCIFDILNYMIVCLGNKAKEDIRYANCIKSVNKCITRLKSYSNFDMTIDNLLFELWGELNENSYRN